MSPHQSGIQRDRGSISVLVAVLIPSLLLVLALLVDGTETMRVRDRADAVAGAAARAGATAIDTRSATLALDRAAALHAARSALTATGHTGTVQIVSNDVVHVTAEHTESAPIGLLKIGRAYV